MSQVSRPVQILFAVTALFGVVWFVALRPKTATSSGGSTPAAQQAPTAPGVKGLSNAVSKAHHAAGTASSDAQRAAGTSADGGGAATTTPASGLPAGAATTTPAHTKAPAHRTHHAARTHQRSHHTARTHHRSHRHAQLAGVRLVTRALRQHKAIAIAFVSPTVADARAVAGELRHVSHFGGRAVTLSAPISQLSRYGVITRDVQIMGAPTTVIVAPNGDASTIEGFTDRTEIEQRLANVLGKAKKHKKHHVKRR